MTSTIFFSYYCNDNDLTVILLGYKFVKNSIFNSKNTLRCYFLFILGDVDKI